MSVENLTRNTRLAWYIISISNPSANIIDFLRKKGLPSGYALWISPCSMIYTTGMKEPVDILFLDRDGVIVNLYKKLPPYCVAESKEEAVGAMELPAETIVRTNTQIGDRLSLSFF